MTEIGIGFCLDFDHAFCAAVSYNKNEKQFAKELMDLQPKIFHLLDGQGGKETDQHLHLGEGNLDLQWCISNMPEDALVSLETKKNTKENLDDFKEDAVFLNRMRKNT